MTPKTKNQAIITLIPKKEDKNFLKYWRPISLLCTDYKIQTKILAKTRFTRKYLVRTKLSNTKQNDL